MHTGNHARVTRLPGHRREVDVNLSEHRRVRLAIGAIVLSSLWYVPWLIMHADYAHPLLSVPFVAAFLYLIVQVYISAFNNWWWTASPTLEIARSRECMVGVIIPTCGEPPDMVHRTLVSVLKQDWPNSKLTIVVSDDAANEDIAAMTRSVGREYPAATIRYHRPPAQGTANRRGDAKAGNLNSALEFFDKKHPEVQYIETRDADDEVGHATFLRRTIAPLLDDEKVAFVQTIKETEVSAGDPFNNQEQLFYRGVMRGRHAANAVFPCGSGVVWRRLALDDIGRFPIWNLVEDLQSGMEALKRGWRGSYVSIVGARAQHAPEDLGNVCKQRGTWALDTMRLLIWRSMKGMNIRQKLQFFDMALFYCQGFPMLILCGMSLIYVVLGVQPVDATTQVYMLHFVPYIIAVELFLWAMAAETGAESLFTVRRMWHGLMFVHMKAATKAFLYGPHRKPVYRVTRKNNVHQWYWHATVPHIVILLSLAIIVPYGVVVHGMHAILRPDTIYWLAMTAGPLGAFIPLSWHGINVRRIILSRLRLLSP
jgi:cellulose synthase (UDP-forming)